MSTLFLWKNRERPSDLKRFVIVWAKRLNLLIPLLKINIKIYKIRWLGGIVGEMVAIGDTIFNGPLNNLKIGSYSSIGRCEIALHDKVTIGNNVVINDGVLILTASHSLTDSYWRAKSLPIYIEDYAWIASNAIILPGVKIGRGAVVGAGSVVRNNIPDYAVVYGNPAICIENKRERKLLYFPALLNASFEAWVGKWPYSFDKKQD